MTVRDRGEGGFVGGADGLAFGVLVFVLGTLVVANVWAVVDAKVAVTAAAREAARAYVEAPAHEEAGGAAEGAAAAALAAHGRTGRFELVMDAPAFERCARVVATARYEVRLGAVPVLGVSAGSLTVSARHSEVVDPYRASAVTGSAAC